MDGGSTQRRGKGSFPPHREQEWQAQEKGGHLCRPTWPDHWQPCVCTATSHGWSWASDTKLRLSLTKGPS